VTCFSNVVAKYFLVSQWGFKEECCAIQTVVPSLKALAPQISQFDTIHDVFKVDSLCFLTYPQNYGFTAKV
jgi:hypothetical protein